MLFTHQDLKEEKKKKGSIEIDLAEPELYVFFLSKTCRLDYPQCFVSGILVDFYSPICVYLWWELILKKNNSGGRWQLKISLRQPVCQKSCYFHGGGGGRSECTCSKYWGGGGETSPLALVQTWKLCLLSGWMPPAHPLKPPPVGSGVLRSSLLVLPGAEIKSRQRSGQRLNF